MMRVDDLGGPPWHRALDPARDRDRELAGAHGLVESIKAQPSVRAGRGLGDRARLAFLFALRQLGKVRA